MSKKNIVVFGASGFLGKNIKKLFEQEKNYQILCPSRKEVDLLKFDELNDFIISQPEETVFINSAAVVGSVHSGLEREILLIDENTRLNLNIFSSLSKLESRFVLINYVSNCIYPHKVNVQSEDLIYEGEPHFTARAFAHTKRHAMQMFEILNTKKNANVNQLILPGLFGEGNHLEENRLHAFDGIIVRMIKAKRQKINKFEVYGTGKPIREWVPALAVSLATKILCDNDNPDTPSILNFSIGFNESIWDTTLRIKNILGYEGEIVKNESFVDGAPIKVLNNKKFLQHYPEYDLNIDVDNEILKSIKYYQNNIL